MAGGNLAGSGGVEAASYSCMLPGTTRAYDLQAAYRSPFMATQAGSLSVPGPVQSIPGTTTVGKKNTAHFIIGLAVMSQ